MEKNRNPDGSPAGDSVQPPASEHGGITKDPKALTSDKNMLLEQADTRTQQANLRTDQANTRTDEANARTELADARTVLANTRTTEANNRTDQADLRTELAEDREQGMRASELSYRRLFETSKDGILILDAGTGMIVDVNPFLEELLGYSHAVFLGKKVWELGLLNDLFTIQVKFAELQEKEYVRYDNLPLKISDGRRIYVEFSSNSYLVDGQLLIQCNIRDITERKLANETNTRLAMAVEQSAELIVITDTRGKILYVNPSFEKTTGYTRAEVIGKNPRILKSGKQDAAYYREMWEVLLRGEIWRGHFINKRKDGTFYEEEATISPVRDETGKVINYLSVKHDVTREMQLEAQLRQSQKMESIGTLAGGIAHDLNNVLTPIMMSVELLKMKEKDERDLNILTIIEDSAKRGADMVKRILFFARGEGGEKIEVQTGPLIEEIQKIVRETFFNNIVLNSNIAPDMWAIHGDPTQLHQVLLNLCVNARDAMPNGGVLTITASNLMVDEQYAGMNIDAKPGLYVKIQLEDNGTGISPEVKERIFEPFFTTKDLGKGTGLGLSTSLGIIKSHGGFIQVYSEVNMGTRFNIYLPALTESNAVSSLATKDLMHGHNELILLVDDEKSVRDITCVTLETFGYRVIMACDGVEATSIYASRKDEIALVLTDMMMPLMDGPTMIQVMLKLNPDLRFIAASGLNSNSLVAKAASAGVKHFIPKPYTAETLLKAVREALED